MSASGSCAQSSRRPVAAGIPICDHWLHAKSSSAAPRRSLRAEICISHSEVRKRLGQLLPEALRGVVRPGPARRLEELAGSRAHCPQVALVLSSSLVDERIQLEVDLVEPACEVDV